MQLPQNGQSCIVQHFRPSYDCSAGTVALIECLLPKRISCTPFVALRLCIGIEGRSNGAIVGDMSFDQLSGAAPAIWKRSRGDRFHVRVQKLRKERLDLFPRFGIEGEDCLRSGEHTLGWSPIGKYHFVGIKHEVEIFIAVVRFRDVHAGHAQHLPRGHQNFTTTEHPFRNR